MQYKGVVITILALACAGCVSFSWEDGQGRRHIVGLSYVVVTPAPKEGPIAGEITSQTTIGLGISLVESQKSLSLGYSKSVTAALKDDVLVVGNPIEAIKQGGGR